MWSHKPPIQSKDEKLDSSFDFILSSPAKTNLFFRVIFKRPDGFHEIASLYQAISFFDSICFRKNGSFTVTSTDPTLPVDHSNLVYRAADLFFTKTGIQPSVHLHLIKNIPIQAGLGGGSGNAATVLWGLNELFEAKVSVQELALWSATLGCDVPFFFSQGTAYCTGKGDLFTEEGVPQIKGDVTIVKPIESLSTPLVYSCCNPLEFPSRDPHLSLQGFNLDQGPFYNDLEIPAFKLLPSLEQLRDALLLAGFSHVVLSGSGSAFFCLGKPKTPDLPANCLIKKARFIQRTHTGWYE